MAELAFACLEAGDVALVSIEKIARNSALETTDGRRSSLHVGDVAVAVFGNRYATLQFEGLALRDGNSCDLLSMGGMCGLVQSRHSAAGEPTKLKLLGGVTNRQGQPVRLRDYYVRPANVATWPHIAVVCGSSMDAGKTHTAMSIIRGLSSAGKKVAGIKLTGTATGKDTWNMLDAGACVALDFIDGGYPSTYLCSHEELLILHRRLVNHAAQTANYVVIEIADGLLQRETAMLLRSPLFTETVDSWVFAGGDPMSAESGVRMMRQCGLEPLAVSGALTMSSLNMREVEAATGMRCLKASELQSGALNSEFDRDFARDDVSELRKSA